MKVNYCLFFHKGFAPKLSQSKDTEEKEKEGMLRYNNITVSRVLNNFTNNNVCVTKASKTVESATGQAMETEDAE